MAILNKIYPLLAALLLTSCYEDFTPDIDVKPVLCLNSRIIAGSPIEVEVTHTWLFSDEVAGRDHKVNDAEVSIYANGILQPSDFIPQEGDRIKIVVESAVYGSAEAEVTVPFSVPIEQLKWTANVIDRKTSDDPKWEMDGSLRFNFTADLTLADPQDELNYYHIRYIGFSPHVESEEVWTEGNPFPAYSDDSAYLEFTLGSLEYETEPIFSEHMAALDAIDGMDSYGFAFFTDRQFSGQNYTLHLHINDMEYKVRNKTYDEKMFDCGLEFILSTVSESYYNWANYGWQTEMGTIGELTDIGLGDPIWAYSNVSTGAGVVVAQSLATYKMSLKEFLRSNL